MRRQRPRRHTVEQEGQDRLGDLVGPIGAVDRPVVVVRPRQLEREAPQLPCPPTDRLYLERPAVGDLPLGGDLEHGQPVTPRPRMTPLSLWERWGEEL